MYFVFIIKTRRKPVSRDNDKITRYYFRVTTSPVAVMQRRDKNGHKKNDGF